MSLLEEQMRELQLKQRKVEFLKTLLTLVVPQAEKAGEGVADFKAQAEQEVSAELQEYILAKIDLIENGTDSIPPISRGALDQNGKVVGQFTDEQFSILLQLVEAAQSRTNITEPASKGAPNDPMARQNNRPAARPQQVQKGPRKDLVAFAMENGRLMGKRVIVHTKDGKIGGVVTGAEAPNLWVKTDTGHIVPVLPENTVLERGD